MCVCCQTAETTAECATTIDAMLPRSAGLYFDGHGEDGWQVRLRKTDGVDRSISECNLALLALIDDLNRSIGLRSLWRRPSRHEEPERLFENDTHRRARASPSAFGVLTANALTGPS